MRIALPKGALMQGALETFAAVGIVVQQEAAGTHAQRKLVFATNHPGTEMMVVRPKDVAVYVEHGGADLGIVGSDIIRECEPEVLTLAAFPFGHCTLVLAGAQDSGCERASDIPAFSRIATKFPKLTRDYFRELGIPVEVIELYGSIELAPLTGLADFIVDLVGTGRTLRENGLVSISSISEHTARLIANRTRWQLYNPEISALVSSLQG
jgi:ATP phosphoribosyltransferase